MLNSYEKIKGRELSPTLRSIYLSSLNYAIYNYILFRENISLHECCLENQQMILLASSGSLPDLGMQIINSYGTDNRYLIAKYHNFHIRSALGYIHTLLSEKLSLQTVCDTVSLNRNYFCQLFLQELGISFARYICLQRVKLARRLLCTTSMPL